MIVRADDGGGGGGEDPKRQCHRESRGFWLLAGPSSPPTPLITPCVEAAAAGQGASSHDDRFVSASVPASVIDRTGRALSLPEAESL